MSCAFAGLFPNLLAGHPTYVTPESATSPEVKRVCSQSILLSSIDAPESNLDSDRIAHWFPILRPCNENLPRELRWATAEQSSKLTSSPIYIRCQLEIWTNKEQFQKIITSMRSGSVIRPFLPPTHIPQFSPMVAPRARKYHTI